MTLEAFCVGNDLSAEWDRQFSLVNTLKEEYCVGW